jgi:hypothetical protein
MKKFSHVQIPAGWTISGEGLKAFITAGQIKLEAVSDGDSVINHDLEECIDYLGDDDYFVNTISGGGEYEYFEGCFIWIYTQKDGVFTMPDRIVQVYLYTEDDGIEDSYDD